MPCRQRAPHASALYHRLSPYYDRVFSPFSASSIRSTISSLQIPPEAKILEVGVGTGVSLCAYPCHAQVTGIDIAQEMLVQAQQRVCRHDWWHVTLRQMDALDMQFPDDQFDYVMAFHIASVVADSEQLMREIVRVTKPGGTIVVINHFRSERRWLAPMMDVLDPVTRRLGWRTTLRLPDVVNHGRLLVHRCYRYSRWSPFTVVRATKPEPRLAEVFAEQRHHAGRNVRSLPHQSPAAASGDTDRPAREESSARQSRSLHSAKNAGGARS